MYNIADNPHMLFSLFLVIFSTTFLTTLLTQHAICTIYQSKFITEPVISIVIGVIVSAAVDSILTATNTKENSEHALGILTFSNEMFFFGFLPPIIFCSGYHLKRSHFFSNFGAISLLAVLGTLISAIFIALSLYYISNSGLVNIKLDFMECIAFGGLISTTDPVSTLSVFQKLKVDPSLFYLVLGESLLNDAIGIAIFSTASSYIGKEFSSYDILIFVFDFMICCFGSCIVGYFTGLLSARVFRSIDPSAEQIFVISLFLGSVYIPFFISEMLHFSGIITILITGITARKYTNKNISAQAKVNASLVFRLLSFLSETSCFLFLGFSIISQKLNFLISSLVGYVLIFCLIGRCLNVYPMLMLVNMTQSGVRLIKTHCTTPTSPTSISSPNTAAIAGSAPLLIPWNIMHMVSYVGMRGIVSFSCANIFNDANGNRDEMIAVTTSIALITLFIQGGFTTSMIKMLNIPTNIAGNASKVSFPSPLLSPNKITQVRTIRDLEHKYLYPLVIRKYQNQSLDIDHSSGGGSFDIEYGDSDENILEASDHQKELVDERGRLDNKAKYNGDETPLLNPI